jgi:hypothetical protein
MLELRLQILDLVGPEYYPVSGFCEQDNELSLCVKAGKIV